MLKEGLIMAAALTTKVAILHFLQRQKSWVAILGLGIFCASQNTWAQSHGHLPSGVELHNRQEFIRNNGAEPESLDPALSETVVSGTILGDLFEGLTAVDNLGNVVAGVAHSWKQTNPTTWVFNLRPNTRFSNGDPVRAQDFVYSWQRFLDPKTASTIAGTLGMFLLNGTEIVAGKKPPSELGVKALDDYALEIKTPIPVPFMPALLTNTPFVPVNKTVIAKLGRDWTKVGNLIGNGAYTLKEAMVNNKIIVEKNPLYWDSAAVHLTRVTYLPIESPNADLKMFQSGQTDWTLILPPGSYAHLRATHPKDIRISSLLAMRFYPLNTNDPLLKDIRVRKALSMVIDRDVLAEKVTADGQIPLYGLIVKGLAGADLTAYEWARWPMAQKVTLARQLLEQAGVPSGTRIRLTYNTSEYHKRMAIFVTSEWKTKLGLEVEMDALEFKVLVKRLHEGNYQVARYGWFASYNDATSFLSLVQCGGDQNFSGGCNQKANDLVAQGNLEVDPSRRKTLLTQAAQLAMEDYPFIPLLQMTLPRLVKSYVGGYSEANVYDSFRSRDLYIIKH